MPDQTHMPEESGSRMPEQQSEPKEIDWTGKPILRDKKGLMLSGTGQIAKTGSPADKITSRQLAAEVRRKLKDTQGDHLNRIITTAKLEHSARDHALKIYSQQVRTLRDLLNGYLKKAQDALDNNKNGDETKELIAAIRELTRVYDKTPKRIKLRLPNLESSKMYHSLVMKSLPVLKSVEVKGENTLDLIKTVLGLQGIEALNYLKFGREAVPQLQGLEVKAKQIEEKAGQDTPEEEREPDPLDELDGF